MNARGPYTTITEPTFVARLLMDSDTATADTVAVGPGSAVGGCRRGVSGGLELAPTDGTDRRAAAVPPYLDDADRRS